MDTLEKVKKSNVQQEVLSQFERQIAQGTWKPGQKIPSENDLALSLGVSRISIRGAIQRLIAQGLLESRHGDGTYVKQISPESCFDALKPLVYLQGVDLLSLIQYRKIVETGIIDLMFDSIAEKEIEELEIHLAHMKKQLKNVKEYVKHDVEYHYTLIRATRNPFIMKVFDIIKEMYVLGIEGIVHSIGPEDGIYYHSRILEALRGHNRPATRKWIREHLASTEKRVMDTVQGITGI